MKGLAQGSCSLKTLAWARGFISRSKSARFVTLLHGLPAGLVNLLKQSTLYEWSLAPPKSMAKLPLISLNKILKVPLGSHPCSTQPSTAPAEERKTKSRREPWCFLSCVCVLLRWICSDRNENLFGGTHRPGCEIGAVQILWLRNRIS